MTDPSAELMEGAAVAFVDVGGRSIAYRRQGQGPPLILLHGFLSDSRCWSAQLSGLSDQFDVIAWDAPGAGRSADPPETVRTADFARSLAGFLDAIGIDCGHVVGLSWGGILAQEFFRLYPGRVTSLVLADTYAGWRGSLGDDAAEVRLSMCLEASTRPPEEVVADFIPGMFTATVAPEIRDELARIISEFHPVGFRAMSSSSAERDSRDVLTNMKAPVLILWGEEDGRSPLRIAREMHAAIPGAQLAIIPAAGHVSNMEQPAAFNGHVLRFCGAQCPVCGGVCPYCACPIGAAAGSMEYVLCSACHAVYSHQEWHGEDAEK